VRSGYVDDGWKDTVLLMPGESVAVTRFETTRACTCITVTFWNTRIRE
jgi:hypothetical protein